MKAQAAASFRFPKPVRAVLARLGEAGFKAYPVGGCVRDLLLGRRVTDWDVTTNARPGQVTGLFQRVIPTGEAHGTVTVLIQDSAIEVTTFRGEVGYRDGRHPDQVIFLDSLEEDLQRRDFTVNAMALDVTAGRILDPFEGQDDLRRRLIRAVGDPVARFSEDGLRPLRAVRFACVLKFEIEPVTSGSIPGSIPIFRKVAAERMREELLKILSSPYAARGIELLRETGLLVEILPELLDGLGHDQNSFHRHDVYRHALASLKRSRGDPVLKLAVLLHDIGKPRVAAGPPGEYTFYGHEKASAELADLALEGLRFSTEERRRVQTLILGHMFHYEAAWSDGAVRRLVRKVGKERLNDLWELRRADAWGRGIGVRSALANLQALKKRVETVLTKDAALKVTDLAIGGTEVMEALGIAPGPKVGKVLDLLLERVLDEPSLNTKEKLTDLVRLVGE